MENVYLYEVSSNEDFDLIEDYEEREEVKEQFKDEVEKVQDYLEEVCIDGFSWEKLDDTRFNVTLETFLESTAEETAFNIYSDLTVLLENEDIAFTTYENINEDVPF